MPAIYSLLCLLSMFGVFFIEYGEENTWSCRVAFHKSISAIYLFLYLDSAFLVICCVCFLQNGQQIVDEPMGEDDINAQTVSKGCCNKDSTIS